MELDKINKLLENYFEGTTSVEEEQALKKYFNGFQVHESLESYKPLFVYIQQSKKEIFEKPLPFSTNNQKRIVWLSMVASVVLIFGVGYYTFMNTNSSQTDNYGTINDPKIAFIETQKALNLISEHVNKGIEGMNYLQEYQQSKNIIFNN